MTPSSGACSTINILPDSIEEGRETFNVSITNAQTIVAEGRGTAQVLIVDFCASLPALENGNVGVSNRTVGSVAMYSCDSGFLISGNPQRNCQADGLWSGQAPLCILGKFVHNIISIRKFIYLTFLLFIGTTEPTSTQFTDSTQAPLNFGIRVGDNGPRFFLMIITLAIIAIILYSYF